MSLPASIWRVLLLTGNQPLWFLCSGHSARKCRAQDSVTAYFGQENPSRRVKIVGHLKKWWDRWPAQGYLPAIKRGNGKPPRNGGFNGKIIYKWQIVHCHVWLPEGIPVLASVLTKQTCKSLQSLMSTVPGIEDVSLFFLRRISEHPCSLPWPVTSFQAAFYSCPKYPKMIFDKIPTFCNSPKWSTALNSSCRSALLYRVFGDVSHLQRHTENDLERAAEPKCQQCFLGKLIGNGCIWMFHWNSKALSW